MYITVFSIQLRIILRTYQADTMFCAGRQILHKYDIHISPADAYITFKYQDRVIAELFLGLGSQRLDLFRQHILQTQDLHSMVVTVKLIGQRIEHGNHTLSVNRLVPPQVCIHRPERSPHITVQIKSIAGNTHRSPQRRSEITDRIPFIVITGLQYRHHSQTNCHK